MSESLFNEIAGITHFSKNTSGIWAVVSEWCLFLLLIPEADDRGCSAKIRPSVAASVIQLDMLIEDM